MGPLGTLSPALIKQELAHLYTCIDMKKHHSDPPFKNGLAAHLWIVWSADGHQLPAPSGPASEVQSHIAPGHTLSEAACIPCLSTESEYGQAISAQCGALTVNTRFSALGLGGRDSTESALQFDFSFCSACFFPLPSQVSIPINIMCP